MKIEEKNTLIAEFMGLTPSSKYLEHYLVSLNGFSSRARTIKEAMKGFGEVAHYHQSWEWLMPVIATIKDSDLKDKGLHLIDKIHEALMQTNIKATYESVFNFIEWYKQKKSILAGIDYEMLREQKEELFNLPNLSENIKGLINLIGEIQDNAVDVLGVSEVDVFGSKL